MFLSLKNNVYVRCVGGYGYISDISTGKQFKFDGSGADWLFALSKRPRDIEDVIDGLIVQYHDVSRKELYEDFYEFVLFLSTEGFVNIADDDSGTSGEVVHTRSNVDAPSISDLTIEITNRCNERCVHCYLSNSKKDAGIYMSLDVIRDLLLQFKEMGGKRVTFTGGEALLHHSLIEACRIANNHNLDIAIFSNLIMLNENIVHSLKSFNIVEVQVSLYSIDPHVHDAITNVKDSCKRTINAIELLVKNGLPVKIACPVMKQNADSVIGVIEYARGLNVNFDLELYINSREDQDDSNLIHRLDIGEMREFLQDLMNYDSQYCKSILHTNKQNYDADYSLLEDLNMPLCQAGYYGLYITSKGDFATCPNMQGYSLGNIANMSLKDVWEKSERINVIRSLQEKDFEMCINCEARDFCIRCPAHNYAEGKDLMTIPKYACQLAFLSKQIIEENNASKTITK